MMLENWASKQCFPGTSKDGQRTEMPVGAACFLLSAILNLLKVRAKRTSRSFQGEKWPMPVELLFGAVRLHQLG